MVVGACVCVCVCAHPGWVLVYFGPLGRERGFFFGGVLPGKVAILMGVADVLVLFGVRNVVCSDCMVAHTVRGPNRGYFQSHTHLTDYLQVERATAD